MKVKKEIWKMKSKEGWGIFFICVCIGYAFIVLGYKMHKNTLPYERAERIEKLQAEFSAKLDTQVSQLETYRKTINNIIAWEKFKFEELDNHTHTHSHTHFGYGKMK